MPSRTGGVNQPCPAPVILVAITTAWRGFVFSQRPTISSVTPTVSAVGGTGGLCAEGHRAQTDF